MTTIYYVGYGAAHPGDFIYEFPEGHDFWLLILTHTPAEIWVQGSVREYPAHCAVLFRPGQKIWYRACVEQFVNDWVRFDTDESYLTETTLPFNRSRLLQQAVSTARYRAFLPVRLSGIVDLVRRRSNMSIA